MTDPLIVPTYKAFLAPRIIFHLYQMVAPGKFHLMQCAAQVPLNLCSSWWTSFTQSVKETSKHGEDEKEALNHGLQPHAF